MTTSPHLTRAQLNSLLGMSEDDLDAEAERLEDETISDSYTGEIIFGAPWERA